MRRHLLGILAAALILGGIIGSIAGWSEHLVVSSSIRIGCVLGALWLAFPQILDVSKRIPPWLAGALVLASLIVAVRPRSLAVVVPVVAALLALQVLGLFLRPPPTASQRKKSVGAPRN